MIPGAAIPKPEEVFGASSAHLVDSSLHIGRDSLHLPDESNFAKTENVKKSQKNQRDGNGLLIAGQLDSPVIDSLEHLVPTFRVELEGVALLPRTKKKVDKVDMEALIVELCTGHYVTGTCIALLVNRDPDALRQRYLQPLVKEGRLRFAFPTAPTHSMQAYRAT